ncbi:MAG: hypothetical protein RIB67_08395 [Miltoncostaeaceae bacterium]
MPRPLTRSASSGQAAVELLALVPAVAVLALVGWQIVVGAHAWLHAAGAARAGERGALVGADPAEAARAAVPEGWGRRLAITPAAGERPLRVHVRIPAVLPGLPPTRPVVAAPRGQRP